MPRNRDELGMPRDWLARARSNLARAKQAKPDDVLWEDLCFDAQQAVEKSIKALLLFKGVPFRYVHDVGELLNLLVSNGVPVPEELLDAAELTEYAVEARYPGPFEPVTDEEAAHAIEIAEKIFAWASSLIEE